MGEALETELEALRKRLNELEGAGNVVKDIEAMQGAGHDNKEKFDQSEVATLVEARLGRRGQ